MTSDTDIISYLRENTDTFSKRQRLIAQYILNNFDKAAYMTAAALGEAVGVSESTVVRFASELGFEGYPKLQKRLREVARANSTSVQRMEIASRRMDASNLLEEVLKSDISKIKQTLEEIDRSQFDGAVEEILRAKKIYIAGARSSASIAGFAEYYFRLMFGNTQLISSSGSADTFEQLMRIDKGDVIIGMSFPRYSKNTVRALEYACKRGACVIGITDSVNSPIVRLSKYFLIAKSDMDSFVDALVAPFSVINALIVALGMRKQAEIKQTFERLENIWEEYEVYDKE